MLESHQFNLKQRIETKTAMVGIIGLGYVGLPLMLRCCDAGFRVLGFDLDLNKITMLSSGQSYIEHIPADLIKTHTDSF